MNKWMGSGNLTKKPELTKTTNSQCCKFTVAVRRPYNKDKEAETDFINITAWGKTAEICAKLLDKGSNVSVIGRLETGSYTNKSGVKVYTTSIVADEVGLFGRNVHSIKQDETIPDFEPIDSTELPF